MTLLSLKQARGRPNRTFPNSRYTPHAFLLQIKANNCPFPWQDRVHTAGTAERATGITVLCANGECAQSVRALH